MAAGADYPGGLALLLATLPQSCLMLLSGLGGWRCGGRCQPKVSSLSAPALRGSLHRGWSGSDRRGIGAAAIWRYAADISIGGAPTWLLCHFYVVLMLWIVHAVEPESQKGNNLSAAFLKQLSCESLDKCVSAV